MAAAAVLDLGDAEAAVPGARERAAMLGRLNATLRHAMNACARSGSGTVACGAAGRG
ncbi:MAG: hypothetical protein SYR96_37100 [Actinomycetota bacterium]|nr:hypothetical protein [Actinomycetota bacterium]